MYFHHSLTICCCHRMSLRQPSLHQVLQKFIQICIMNCRYRDAIIWSVRKITVVTNMFHINITCISISQTLYILYHTQIPSTSGIFFSRETNKEDQALTVSDLLYYITEPQQRQLQTHISSLVAKLSWFCNIQPICEFCSLPESNGIWNLCPSCSSPCVF